MIELNKLDETVPIKNNAMLKVRPELFCEWDFEKNNGLDIYKIAQGTHKVVWWICPKCNSSYDMIVNKRSIGANCPYCAGSRVNESNSLASNYPHLMTEWHPTKNGELSAHNISYGSSQSVWWICLKCNSSYQMMVANRTSAKNGNCIYCFGDSINYTNSLATTNPVLSLEWNSFKNKNVTPHTVTYGSSRKVWWICDEGHEWKASISNRVKERGCPYCSNKKVKIGYNDLWTTHPFIAELLIDSEIGYKYTFGASYKTNWKCCSCGITIKNKSIVSVVTSGLSCPRCSDGVSYGEKFIYNLLTENKLDFIYDSTLKWSKGKRYDFYLQLYNMIIEVHGRQHYENCSGNVMRSLEEEQANDLFKEVLAKNNGIEHYIVIDARKSDYEWIKNSVLHSDIVKIFESLDFENVRELSTKTFVKIISELWENRIGGINEILHKTKMSRSAVIRYLKIGAELGWCNYNPKEEMIKASYNQGIKNNKVILQFSMEGEFIKEWHSGAEASKVLGISKGNISMACSGSRPFAGGYKWKYKYPQKSKRRTNK